MAVEVRATGAAARGTRKRMIAVVIALSTGVSDRW
jgi:hypothetical protein